MRVHDAALIADGARTRPFDLAHGFTTHLTHTLQHQLQARHACF
jgi:hypothetical protein